MGQLGDKKFLILSIEEQLGAINEQFEVIKNHNARIPRIEVDIIKSYVREVYEYLCSLEQNNLNFEKETAEARKITKVEKPKAAVENKAEAIKTEKKVIPPAVPAAIAEAPIADPTPKKEPVKKVVKPDKEVVVKPVEKKASAPIHPLKDKKETKGDLFSPSGSIIAERLMKTKDSTIAGKIKKTPIGDLKKAIGINEKFLYINELFEGNMQSYDQAIDALNNSQSKLEMERLIRQYKRAYKWELESDAYQRFDELLGRRFQ